MDFQSLLLTKLQIYDRGNFRGNNGDCWVGIEIDENGKVVMKKIVREIGAQCGKTVVKMLDNQEFIWASPGDKNYVIIVPFRFAR